MIAGAVSHRRAYVSLILRGPAGQEVNVEFVLDTGFTGVATLPPAACAALSLRTLRLQPARLADGTRIILEVYEAAFLWDGVERAVEVLAMEGAPLIGMSLLYGSRLLVDVVDGGPVTITPLP
jgi:clan AA aspartic protease